MKVSFKKPFDVQIDKLVVGNTFTAKRRSTNEIGLYMIVDKNSGVFLDSYKNSIMAVNLVTGQIRSFAKREKVEPVNAEVNLLEKE